MWLGWSGQVSNILVDDVAQMSCGTNVTWEKCQAGQMSGGKNVRWDKCQVGQMSGGTNVMWDKSHCGTNVTFYNRLDKCHIFYIGGTNVSFYV